LAAGRQRDSTDPDSPDRQQATPAQFGHRPVFVVVLFTHPCTPVSAWPPFGLLIACPSTANGGHAGSVHRAQLRRCLDD
jgi:hypothetical protein